jgi:hypothetical protein
MCCPLAGGRSLLRHDQVDASVLAPEFSTIHSEVSMSKRFERWTARAEATVVGAALVLAAIAYVISRLSG